MPLIAIAIVNLVVGAISYYIGYYGGEKNEAKRHVKYCSCPSCTSIRKYHENLSKLWSDQ